MKRFRLWLAAKLQRLLERIEEREARERDLESSNRALRMLRADVERATAERLRRRYPEAFR